MTRRRFRSEARRMIVPDDSVQIISCIGAAADGWKEMHQGRKAPAAGVSCRRDVGLFLQSWRFKCSLESRNES